MKDDHQRISKEDLNFQKIVESINVNILIEIFNEEQNKVKEWLKNKQSFRDVWE